MKKKKNFLISFFLLIGFSGLGFAIGINAGNDAAYRKSEGYNSSWKLLDATYQFNKIIDATNNMIWTQAQNGKLYSFSFCRDEPDCNQWIETQKVPDDIHENERSETTKGTSCPPTDLKGFTNPPGIVIECVKVETPGWDNMGANLIDYYALLDDGKIWIWSYDHASIDDAAISIVTTLFYLGGGCGAGILSVIIYSVTIKRKHPPQANENSKTREN